MGQAVLITGQVGHIGASVLIPPYTRARECNAHMDYLPTSAPCAPLPTLVVAMPSTTAPGFLESEERDAIVREAELAMMVAGTARDSTVAVVTDKATASVKVDHAGTRVSTVAELSHHYPGAQSRRDAERSIEIQRTNLLSDPCTYGLEEIARDTDDQIRDAELCSASHRPQAFAATGTVKNNVHFSSPRLEIETPKPSCVAYGEVAIADAVDFRTMAGSWKVPIRPTDRPMRTVHGFSLPPVGRMGPSQHPPQRGNCASA
jgi:hypothetical protein